MEAAAGVDDGRGRIGAHAEGAHDVARARRADERVVDRGDEGLLGPHAGLGTDLLHVGQVELARLGLVGVVAVRDAGDGAPVDVGVAAIEIDGVRALRRVLGLHSEPEEMLPDRPVADGVLEPDARAETEVPRELDRVDVGVFGDRLAL